MRSGRNNSCPICGRQHQDLVGQVFQRLTIARCAGKVRARNTIWECSCTCGALIEAEYSRLKSGNTGSCGCLQKELVAAKNAARIKHGMKGTKVYRAWRGIKDRCLNPSCHAYKNYGGRGIELHPDWMEFEPFYQDVGDPPDEALTIDRIDNSLGYVPGNCKWSTRKEQTRNRRTTNFLTIDGEVKSAGAWAEHYGIPVKLFWDRAIKLGWDINAAVTTPKKRSKNDV